MKKVLLIIVVVAAIASMSSCKKDYTCTCVTSTDGNEVSTPYPMENQKKSDAEAACDKLESSVSNGLSTVTTTCELK